MQNTSATLWSWLQANWQGLLELALILYIIKLVWEYVSRSQNPALKKVADNGNNLTPIFMASVIALAWFFLGDLIAMAIAWIFIGVKIENRRIAKKVTGR